MNMTIVSDSRPPKRQQWPSICQRRGANVDWYVIVKRRRKAGEEDLSSAANHKFHCPAVAIGYQQTVQQPALPSSAGSFGAGHTSTSLAFRTRPKGLLERRGSSASLTLDLSMDAPFARITPPMECSAAEYLAVAGNRMTRHQLRNIIKHPKVLMQEFLEIPLNHPNKVELLSGCANKNRYQGIWPNAWSRLVLQRDENGNEETPEPSSSTTFRPPQFPRVPPSRYINANYIRGYDGESRRFIATQGPLENTVDDFWLMVWQEKAPCVVQMTKLTENNKSKCAPYLPSKEGQYGPIKVVVKLTVPKNGYSVRHLILQKTGGAESEGAERVGPRSVKHFWFSCWPDHKAPAATGRRQLLDMANDVRLCLRRQRTMRLSHSTCPSPTASPTVPSPSPSPAAVCGPVVVHCSAGIGRTGCFIGTYTGMKQLREENMVDVLAIVCQMRLDRGGMVHNPEQYEFLHHALALYERQLADAPMALTSSSNESNSTSPEDDSYCPPPPVAS